MIIESRVTDISGELQVSNEAKIAESRQRSGTSSLSDNSTRKPITSQRVSTLNMAQVNSQPVAKPIDVHKAVEKLNQLVRSQQRDISFSVDKDAKATVIKVFKTETGELIKQFPPEEILAMIARLRKTVGLLIDSKL